jgi:hypothetical protein
VHFFFIPNDNPVCSLSNIQSSCMQIVVVNCMGLRDRLRSGMPSVSILVDENDLIGRH